MCRLWEAVPEYWCSFVKSPVGTCHQPCSGHLKQTGNVNVTCGLVATDLGGLLAGCHTMQPKTHLELWTNLGVLCCNPNCSVKDALKLMNVNSRKVVK